jgi:DNA-binding GntR family transcriptional regulator
MAGTPYAMSHDDRGPVTLSSLNTLSLREQAASAIRTGIVTGAITAGEIYSVPNLAEELGVSATPVREAMLDLVGEGLVVPVRNRGYRVVSMSTKDLDAVLTIRLLLEVPSMGEVAGLAKGRDLREFRELAARMPKFARAGDIQAYLDADAQFHLGLLGLLGNDRLVDIVAMLRNQSRLFDIGGLAHAGKLAEAGAEHTVILDAIEAGQRKRVESLVREHLLGVREAWSGRP